MKKKKAHFVLVSEENKLEEEINLEEQNNIYYFRLKDSSKNRFSKEDKTFTRETKEMMLELDFKMVENSRLYLKKEHLEYKIDLKRIKCHITSTKVEIEYELNKEKYLMKIVLEGE